PRLFHDITVFVPHSCGYLRRSFREITHEQLSTKLSAKGFDAVHLVDDKPQQLLQLRDCEHTAIDIDDVELRDGMQLAVVVWGEQVRGAGMGKVATLSGWQAGQIRVDKFECSEWAKARLADDTAYVCGESAPVVACCNALASAAVLQCSTVGMPSPGAERWCFTFLKGLVGGEPMRVDIDGMAFSELRVVLVERKPRITLIHVKELGLKMLKLKAAVGGSALKLVECDAPFTSTLRHPATLEMKPLEVYLMADGWLDDSDEQAACALRMERLGIQPVLPAGVAYVVGDSCHRWPVQDDNMRRRGQKFLSKGVMQQQSGDTGSDAGVSTGGRAAGPNAAVGIGRRVGQAAFSPVPARHLHTRAHSATAGVQRRVASFCCPAHLPHRHATSRPAARRL
ncbi:hypothetical protein TSOC_005176, partial [Tetrabaena socialis]